MGDKRLGELPRTRNWLKVIALLEAPINPAQIARATSEAAERGFDLAKKDQGVADTAYMLMKLVWSAHGDDYRQELSQVGISVSDKASLLDIVGAFDEALDRRMRQRGHRTDLAEMARFSAVDALTDVCQGKTGSLFGVSIGDTQQVLKRYATAERFGAIGKNFLGKFLYRFLDYHLSRELANHIGREKQFNINGCLQFKEALDRHCRETVLIIKDFSGCWPAATKYKEGISPENVRTKFLPVAFKKIRGELRKREGTDA
jgi:hypothetical protein